MGELLKQLRKDNMQAMKDHDTIKKGVLSLVISSIALKEKESGKELSKEEEITCIQKELKQQKDSLAETPASRTDLIDQTNQKIAILEGYLPKQMSEEEIREAIMKIVSDQNLELTKKSQGKIMKTMMSEYKGKTDGKAVNQVLGTLLK
ncbi:MAG: GatB/YqeY domain-containing protein [Erysipelotrichaceae bacterium]|nr:GatB/YqeY domain-containing protein [Erysipelotrichaceae bacterium]